MNMTIRRLISSALMTSNCCFLECKHKLKQNVAYDDTIAVIQNSKSFPGLKSRPLLISCQEIRPDLNDRILEELPLSRHLRRMKLPGHLGEIPIRPFESV
jgi:hypothetical protein